MPRFRRLPPEGIPGVSIPVAAPGQLEIVQAFVNTAPTDGQADALASPAALGRWLSRRGYLAAGAEVSANDLKRTREARAALRDLLAAKTRGELDAEAAARLEQAAGHAHCRPTCDDGGPVGFAPAGPDLDGALGVILAAFVVARGTVHWPHFRLCARQTCRRAFYDASRSRTGRWCTSRCGNRVRGAAYRRSKKHSLKGTDSR